MMGHENFLGVRGGGADGRKKGSSSPTSFLARYTYCIGMYLLYHGILPCQCCTELVLRLLLGQTKPNTANTYLPRQWARVAKIRCK